MKRETLAGCGARWALLVAGCGVMLPGVVRPALSAVTVKLVFADLTDAEKQAIKDKMQKEFDDDLGKGKVDVTDDPKATGDRTVNFQDSYSTPKGDCFGDDGDHKTVNVYLKEFDKPELNTTDKKTNAIEETAVHEVGHSYSADDDKDTSGGKHKMSDGSLKSMDERAADNRHFNERDKTKILKNLGKEHKPTGGGKKDVVVYDDFQNVRPGPYEGDDARDVQAMIRVGGPLMNDFELGWMSGNASGGRDFIVDWMPDLPGQSQTFMDQDLLDFTLRGRAGTPFENLLFSAGDFAQLQLTDPFLNPKYGMTVYRDLQMSFDVTGDGIPDAVYGLNTPGYSDPNTKNGFVIVPEPVAWLGIPALWLAVATRRGGKRE